MRPVCTSGVAEIPTPGFGYRPGMDLRSWLIDAHLDLHDRLRTAVLRLVPTQRWHEQADGGGSSIAALLLHLARHQDLALSTAIRDHAPLYLTHREALGLAEAPTWAGLSEREDRAITRAVPAAALLDYVDVVFDATHTWLDHLSLMALDTVPDTATRLSVRAELPHEQVDWLYGMWTDRTVGWFVQWPILGHGHAHVGEAISIRNRMGLSPF
jgi:hypothetical protein